MPDRDVEGDVVFYRREFSKVQDGAKTCAVSWVRYETDISVSFT